MTDTDLGDPLTPQDGDPTQVTLTLDAPTVQAIVAALNELPAKISRRALESIERQVKATVLDARRARKAQPPAPPAPMNRHQRRAARHKQNGLAAAAK